MRAQRHSILYLQLMQLVGVVSGTTAPEHTTDRVQDQHEYIPTIAKAAVQLTTVRSGPELAGAIQETVELLGSCTPNGPSVSMLCSSALETDVVRRSSIEVCLRILELTNGDFDQFAKECLEISGDFHIFKKMSQTMLSEIFAVDVAADYTKFLNLVRCLTPLQKTTLSRSLEVNLKDSKNTLVADLSAGIGRLMQMDEDIEYTLAVFKVQDELYGPTLSVLGRLLPISRFVMKHYLKNTLKLDLKTVNVVKFCGVTFTGAPDLFNLIDEAWESQIHTVNFSNCRFANNVFSISEADTEKMQGVSKLIFQGCQLVDFDGSLRRATKLTHLAVYHQRFTEIPRVIFDITSLDTLILNTGEISFVSKDIARLTNLKTLSLSDNKLPEFPMGVLQLAGLECLMLSSNAITSIPNTLSNLKMLSRLHISENKIKFPTFNFAALPLEELSIGNNRFNTLPKSICNLRKLKHLNMRNLHLESLPPNFHVHLQHTLEALVLSRNNLMSVPPSIQHLKKLKTLLLDANKIKYFPDEMAVLPELKSLVLNGNPLGRIPSYVLRLTTLTDLRLNNVKLNDIGPEISRLHELESLEVSGNFFNGDGALGSIADGLPNLTELYIAGNQGRSFAIPANIGRLKRLKTLVLNGGLIDELPDSLCELPDLETLKLKDNHISKLPTKLGETVKLKYLDLTNNKLQEIPAGLQGMGSRLHTIIMSKNHLTELPLWMDEFKGLKNANFSQNRISSIDESIVWSPSLQAICLNNNALNVFPYCFLRVKMLRHLDLANNRIEGIIPKGIGNLINAIRIDISTNQMVAQAPRKFQTLQSLTDLNVSFNRFSQLPIDIGALPALEFLNISSNNLRSIPACLYNLRGLTHLKAFSNNIRELSCMVKGLRRLVHLDIHSNNLTQLPDEISQLSNLEFLNIGTNHITHLPKNIGNLSALGTLIFDNNHVTILPPSFSNLRSLVSLYGRNNQIQTIRSDIKNLTALKYVDFRNNRLNKSSFTNLRQLNAVYVNGKHVYGDSPYPKSTKRSYDDAPEPECDDIPEPECESQPVYPPNLMKIKCASDNEVPLEPNVVDQGNSAAPVNNSPVEHPVAYHQRNEDPAEYQHWPPHNHIPQEYYTQEYPTQEYYVPQEYPTQEYYTQQEYPTQGYYNPQDYYTPQAYNSYPPYIYATPAPGAHNQHMGGQLYALVGYVLVPPYEHPNMAPPAIAMNPPVDIQNQN